MINDHLDPHQAYEDGWLERRLERHRDEVERFDVPTDAMVIARLPHDKRGVPIVPGCLVKYTDRLFGEEQYEVLALMRNNTVEITHATRRNYVTCTAGGTIEVIRMENER